MKILFNYLLYTHSDNLLPRLFSFVSCHLLINSSSFFPVTSVPEFVFSLPLTVLSLMYVVYLCVLMLCQFVLYLVVPSVWPFLSRAEISLFFLGLRLVSPEPRLFLGF